MLHFNIKREEGKATEREKKQTHTSTTEKK